MQRILVVAVVIFVLVGVVGYAVLARQSAGALERAQSEHEAALAAAEERCAETARALARDLTRTLAAVIADEVAVGNTGQLDSELAAVVRGEHVAGVLVLDTNGTVLASTDLRYRGRTLDDAPTQAALSTSEVVLAPDAPSPGQIEVQGPLYVGGEMVGAVRVFVDLGDAAGP